VDSLHHHHALEEEYYFPEMEKKLGKGALAGNVDQHHEFVPQVVELKQHLEDIKAGKEKYDGALLVEKIHSFSDIMINHLNEVIIHHRCPQHSPTRKLCVQEIASLESSRIRAAFTEKELKDIDDGFMKLMMAKIEFSTRLPMSLICGNPATH
jgi:hemerythrin-like domain-containing protein